MTRSCSAVGCSTRDTVLSRERGLSFHQFPTDTIQRSKWIRAVNRVDPRSKKIWIPGPGAILCSRHFQKCDFESYGVRRKLKKGAVPSLSLCKVPQGVRLTGKASQNIQKQPLPDDSEEVATEDHNYSLRNPWTVGAEKLAEVQQMLQMSQKRIVTVKNYRMIKRRKGLQLIDALVEEKLLSEETECLLRAQFSDFKWDLYNWKETSEYSTEMKQFACMLYLCSSKVYDYVRKILKLPHSSILRTWLTKCKSSPGFNSNIFSFLQQRVESGDQQYHYCSLIIKGIPLKQQLQWDPSSQSLQGFMDFGLGKLDADETPLATETVLLMAVGIFGHWRMPLGYFFVNRASGYLQAQLLRLTIGKLSDVGVTVLAVTSDATAHSVQMAKALGIHMDGDNIKCTFQHPSSSSQQIAYFFDSCHLLKLVRNAFQSFQSIQFINGTAHWQHVVELVLLDEQELSSIQGIPSKLANLKNHVLKMNCAAQLFSESVARALEYLLSLGLLPFQNCIGTIHFLRLISNLFDIFNGRNCYGKGLKKPLLPETFSEINHVLIEAKTIFLTLSDNSNNQIIKGKRKLGFLGFLLNGESLKWLYQNYVSPKVMPFPYLLTYKFSQDHIELFLNMLRQMLVTSSSLTCMAFQKAYHNLETRYRFQDEVFLSEVSIFDISVAQRKDLALRTVQHQYGGSVVNSLFHEDICHDWSDCSLSEALLDLSEHRQRLIYCAGYVANRLSVLLLCEDCISALYESDPKASKIGSLLCVKKKNGFHFPSESLCRVIHICDRVVRTHSRKAISELVPKQRELYLQQKILHELSGHSYLFIDLDEHLFDGEVCAINHFVKLLKEIIICFLNIRDHDVAQYSLRHSEKLEMKASPRKHWSFLQDYGCSSFTNNKFRRLLHNNGYPFK
ncbi:THAP domain-containing protein 9 [Heterocephalus glaber]|uniref:DNA transposase THAP9 isoform X2 n=1 Tax=Heterocephalus glaber TaxID=10181 RepID=G5ALN2_HETGA|nr:DNA transposase THAP9 isoform X2 [Heterocephalus glaber]EHA97942.1 THAP domain-containing protein 9 [Heterocephalus glaber]